MTTTTTGDNNMDKQLIRYHVRRNRMSGTSITVYDGSSDEARFGPCGGRWVTMCDTHGAFSRNAVYRHARDIAADPTGWCASCAAAYKQRVDAERVGPEYEPVHVVVFGPGCDDTHDFHVHAAMCGDSALYGPGGTWPIGDGPMPLAPRTVNDLAELLLGDLVAETIDHGTPAWREGVRLAAERMRLFPCLGNLPHGFDEVTA